MNCPKCSAAMEKVSFEGIEVDRCTSCRGMWFDAMEHEKLKKKEGSGVIDTAPLAQDASVPHKIMCPHCHTPMISMAVRGMGKLKFESCTVCYGVFFDAGEFREYKGEGVMGRLRGLVGG